MAAKKVRSANEVSFEELLACPHLQFDLNNELLPHLLAFGPPVSAPPAAAPPAVAAVRRPWLFEAVTNTTVAYG